MSSDITLNTINTVLTFLPLFKSQNAKLDEFQIETSLLDPYRSSNELNNFIKTLYRENFVISFDWVAWQDEAKCFINNPKLLDSADISTIQKLLTTHIRKERFCSCHLATVINNGHILAIMNRLAAIAADMVRENANN